jgi:DivIVA domain-containing protein
VSGDGGRFGIAARGYDRAQVDAHCTRIEATLAGTAGPLAITADEAVNPSFTIVLRGYAHHEVEAWVRARAAQLPGTLPVPVAQQRQRRAEVLRVAERPAEKRFPGVRMREGYDLAEVDAFVDHIRASLGTTLTADEVRHIQFTTVRLRFGYVMQAVDEYLDEVLAQVNAGPAPAPAAAAATPAGAVDAVAAEQSTTEWRESLDERYALLKVADRPRGQRFERSGLAKGYEADQVDAFVDHVRGTLTSSLTRAEVANVRFTAARGGYRDHEVDAWLAAVQQHTRT